jgi:large subunit ribosomal protein L21
MRYVVIQAGGKQYKVSEGTEFEVDKLKAEPGKEFTFDNVLMYAADGVFQVGTPTLTNVAVTATVVDQIKGKKIRVAKFKAKARYRRVQGFRAHLTKVKIEKITAKSAAKS